MCVLYFGLIRNHYSWKPKGMRTNEGVRKKKNLKIRKEQEEKKKKKKKRKENICRKARITRCASCILVWFVITTHETKKVDKRKKQKEKRKKQEKKQIKQSYDLSVQQKKKKNKKAFFLYYFLLSVTKSSFVLLHDIQFKIKIEKFLTWTAKL